MLFVAEREEGEGGWLFKLIVKMHKIAELSLVWAASTIAMTTTSNNF